MEKLPNYRFLTSGSFILLCPLVLNFFAYQTAHVIYLPIFLNQRHFINQRLPVIASDYHKNTSVTVLG